MEEKLRVESLLLHMKRSQLWRLGHLVGQRPPAEPSLLVWERLAVPSPPGGMSDVQQFPLNVIQHDHEQHAVPVRVVQGDVDSFYFVSARFKRTDFTPFLSQLLAGALNLHPGIILYRFNPPKPV